MKFLDVGQAWHEYEHSALYKRIFFILLQVDQKFLEDEENMAHTEMCEVLRYLNDFGTYINIQNHVHCSIEISV